MEEVAKAEPQISQNPLDSRFQGRRCTDPHVKFSKEEHNGGSLSQAKFSPNL